jgi:type I restriction-modification system DNA methylase subunit
MEEAHQEIATLIAKYQSLDEKTVKKYSEADTRRVFILPLFKALGWDVYSREEITEEERASGGRVDYAFKLHGVSQFYLEAKALRADLNKLEYAKQVTTYAYNKGVTWAVLTDFEGLKVFNAQTGRLCLNLSYHDYLPDFSELWLLSREAFEKNALNEWAEKHGVLPPRLGIEQRLYNQLRQWREELYTQLYHYNRHLTFDQIDEVIQRLFNRLIFIRTSEDRGIEERVLLSALHQWRGGGRKGELIEVLQRIFRNFDGYYDSDLFQPHLTDQVFIEGATIESIINGLYDVPGTMASYDFSVIDADVLGAVYEQYLGHVATVVKQRVKEAQARMDLGFPSEPIFEVTAKRQRRKEHGIYYTPRFVTDYIVKETVGRFLQERTYNEVNNIKIIDPACGSGSFLIRAYDELLNYHADKRGKAAAELGQWERLPILTGNIFGVDLDIQAVEIARLNLLLRSLARREVLPSLASNICQGNSLISGTEEELRPYFGDAWREKRPFNWEQEFKDIMAHGGFDVVIGNPPYIGFQGFVDPEQGKAYLRDHYDSAIGRFDIYLPFLERGIKLLKEGGLLGFICPTNFMKRQHGKALRDFLLANCKLLRIVDFQDFQVFEEALNYTGIFILQKFRASAEHELQYVTRRIDNPPIAVKQSNLTTGSWIVVRPSATELVSKIKQPSIPLGDLVDSISEGIVTGKNEVFVLTSSKANSLVLEKDLLKTVLQGKQIRRYYLEPPTRLLIYPYRIHNGKSEVIRESDLGSQFHAIWSYLNSQRGLLSGRGYFDKSGKSWYELWCERSFAQQAADKIVVSELASTNRFAYCGKDIFYLDTACGIIPKDKSFSALLYLLGILNSPLMESYYKLTTVPKASGFYIYKTMFLKDLPIRSINFDIPTEKKLYHDLVALVDRMLELNKRLAPIRTTPCNERDELLREIERTDQEIDNLVYDLYGLTDEERKIVEGGQRS